MIISVCNQKGGVGKTTTTVNLGAGIARQGSRVLLVDIDPQGGLTNSLGVFDPDRNIDHVFKKEFSLVDVIRSRSGLDIVPSDIRLAGVERTPDIQSYYLLKKELQGIRGQYDYILIDCPPSLGILTIGAFMASDYLLIPMQTEFLSLRGFDQLLESYQASKDQNPALKIAGVVFTMFDQRRRLDKVTIQSLTDDKVNIFNSIIRRSVDLAEAPVHQKTIFKYNLNGRGASDYESFSQEFIKWVNQK